MTLTEEDKKRIEEEELYRQKVREEQLHPNHQLNENKKPKKKLTRWWIVLIGIVLFAGIIRMLFSSNSTHTPIPQTINNSTPTPIDFDALRKKHINISRKVMMDTFKKEGFVFKKFNTGNKLNMDSYIGTKDKAAIELTGNEDNLYAISFNADMGFDPDGTIGKSLVAQSQMLYFASLINKESVEWLTNEIQKAAANPGLLYNNQAEVSGRNYSYNCVPAITCLFNVESI